MDADVRSSELAAHDPGIDDAAQRTNPKINAESGNR
jgi:hypothetical protein